MKIIQHQSSEGTAVVPDEKKKASGVSKQHIQSQHSSICLRARVNTHTYMWSTKISCKHIRRLLHSRINPCLVKSAFKDISTPAKRHLFFSLLTLILDTLFLCLGHLMVKFSSLRALPDCTAQGKWYFWGQSLKKHPKVAPTLLQNEQTDSCASRIASSSP